MLISLPSDLRLIFFRSIIMNNIVILNRFHIDKYFLPTSHHHYSTTETFATEI